MRLIQIGNIEMVSVTFPFDRILTFGHIDSVNLNVAGMVG